MVIGARPRGQNGTFIKQPPKATGTNVECDVQKEEQQQMQLSEIAAQHSSEHPAIRSGAGRT